MIGATCAVLLASTVAFAQDKAMRVRGTVEQIDGTVMTVKSREGDTLKIKLADEGKVVALVKASLADIKPNSFVGSTAMPQPDGRMAPGKRSRFISFRRKCVGPEKATGRMITGRKAP